MTSYRHSGSPYPLPDPAITAHSMPPFPRARVKPGGGGIPVRGHGDGDGGMKATSDIYEELIEAIVWGDPVPEAFEPLEAFAEQVRRLGCAPAPPPSPELAKLLAGRDADLVVVGIPGGRSERKRMPGIDRVAGLTGKVASLGLVAKLGLGASLAAAAAAGAGAAGVLPASANHAVRGAIENVTPVEFDSNGDDGSNFGDRVSADATGESDGEHGVDGQQISDEAPGADNRPDSGPADEAPGQSGETGLTRANQTPGAENAPDTPGAASADAEQGDPDGDGEPGTAGEDGRPETTPSTVPDPATDHRPAG
jgi:hypothetical protein